MEKFTHCFPNAQNPTKGLLWGLLHLGINFLFFLFFFEYFDHNVIYIYFFWICELFLLSFSLLEYWSIRYWCDWWIIQYENFNGLCTTSVYKMFSRYVLSFSKLPNRNCNSTYWFTAWYTAPLSNWTLSSNQKALNTNWQAMLHSITLDTVCCRPKVLE